MLTYKLLQDASAQWLLGLEARHLLRKPVAEELAVDVLLLHLQLLGIVFVLLLVLELLLHGLVDLQVLEVIEDREALLLVALNSQPSKGSVELIVVDEARHRPRESTEVGVDLVALEIEAAVHVDCQLLEARRTRYRLLLVLLQLPSRLDHFFLAGLLDFGPQLYTIGRIIDEEVEALLDQRELDEAVLVLLKVVDEIKNVAFAQAFLRVDELGNARDGHVQVARANQGLILVIVEVLALEQLPEELHLVLYDLFADESLYLGHRVEAALRLLHLRVALALRGLCLDSCT